jgi:hypothetical protein
MNSTLAASAVDKLVRPQQQRILLLHHASKCQFIGSTCPITPHCGEMKHLWLHMRNCKMKSCAESRCLPSRQVLWHFSKCSKSNCQVCAPVRRKIDKDTVYNKREGLAVSIEVKAKRQKLSVLQTGNDLMNVVDTSQQ